jgi:hypothetical protein
LDLTKSFVRELVRGKLGARKIQNKCRENFSVLERKLLQSLRAEAGRRLKIGIWIFVKKSSNFVQERQL